MNDVSLFRQIAETGHQLSERFYELLKAQYAGGQSAEFYCLLTPDDLSCMGMSSEWSVTFRNLQTRQLFHTTLATCLAPDVRYPVFRQAFQKFGLRLNHPYAMAFNGHPRRYPDDPSREFSPGAEVRVTESAPVFVRPIGDLSHSIWLDAELRVDKSRDGKSLIGCNLDPFCVPTADRPRRGPDWGNRWEAFRAGSSLPSTFYVLLSDHGKHDYIPIARLVGYDPADGAHIFQLDSRVGVKIPSV